MIKDPRRDQPGTTMLPPIVSTIVPVGCQWGSWDQWSNCNNTCGKGTMVRYRTESNKEEIKQSCNSTESEKYEKKECIGELCPGWLCF